MKPASLALSAAAALAVLCVVREASAQTPPTPVEGTPAAPPAQAAAPKPPVPAVSFGRKNELAISSDAGLLIANTTTQGFHGSTTTITVLPSVDYFLVDHFSIGGFVGLNYTRREGGHTTQFLTGPRVGYDIPVGRYLSVWPKLGLSVSSTSQSVDIVDLTTNTTSKQSTSHTNMAVNVFVPVLVHPVEHFFVGFGPALDADITGDTKTTTISGRLTIGGYLGF
ncbi:hypothetical protein [Labilithrix luteola]|uniref:hypothetical protein n=1 Tax=Labilithrix luteola TaxID=1391654 RepID=UPI0011BA8A85|nr:hypothetical protein [Labilithrix luteola]